MYHLVCCNVKSFHMTNEQWTFLFQVIDALAGFATVLTFIFFFRKDKSKQDQINKLANISQVLTANNETLKKLVQLQSDQVEILTRSESANKIDKESSLKIVEIQEKKLKLSVLPKLIVTNVLSKGYQGEILIYIKNIGELATLTEFKVTNGNMLLFDQHLPFELLTDQERIVYIKTPDGSNANNATYRLEIYFIDKLKNYYRLTLIGEGAKHTIDENNIEI